MTLIEKKASKLFYQMYNGTKFSSKKDVKHCLTVAVDVMLELVIESELDAEYWREITQEIINIK
jgi:hypothetical protein